MFVTSSSRKTFNEHPQPGDAVDCPICRGSGTYGMTNEQSCLRCNGTGKTVIVQARCPVCRGTGTVDPSSAPCHVCNKSGWIYKVH